MSVVINPLMEGFAAVLGIDPLIAAELVERMENDNYDPKRNYFIYVAQELPVLDLNLTTNVIPIASGSYGQISRIKNEKRPNRVIKEQLINFAVDLGKKYPDEIKAVLTEVNLFLRDIFIEAFIQFILGNDMIYGNNVVKIYKLYRSAEMDRIFIEMERIDGDIWAYSKFTCSRTGTLNTNFIVSMLMNTAYILMNLNARFSFVHRDLKVNNIGFKVIGDRIRVMFFDFGASCINYNGKRISAKSYTDNVGLPCNISGDLALLCYSIYLQLYPCLDKLVIGFLRDMLLHDGLAKELENITIRKGLKQKIHSAYNFNSTLFYGKYAHMNPDRFIESLNAFIVRNGLEPVILDPSPNTNNSRSLTYSVNSNSEGGRRRRRTVRKGRRGRRTVRRA